MSLVDPNHRAVTGNFKAKWKTLVDTKFKLSWTPKVHYICDHFSDFFEDPLVEGRALGHTTDQIIEHMHSYINRLLTKSFYKLKNCLSEKA